jgi:hypothetical protein
LKKQIKESRRDTQVSLKEIVQTGNIKYHQSISTINSDQTIFINYYVTLPQKILSPKITIPFPSPNSKVTDIAF